MGPGAWIVIAWPSAVISTSSVSDSFKRLWRYLLPVLLAAILHTACCGHAAERVELRATHPDGVPLHALAGGGHDFERVADGTVAEVLETGKGGRWLRVRLPDRRSGWISHRYVAADRPSSVWRSRAACRRIVSAGDRLERPDEPTLRLGSWNIEWFPRGCSPEEDCPERETDIDWLACTIAWMDPDLLAVQEVVKGDPAPRAIDRLLKQLGELGGGVLDHRQLGHHVRCRIAGSVGALREQVQA
jgi:hypothetical protein